VSSTQYYLAQTLDGYIADSDGGLDWLFRLDGETELDASQVTEREYDRFFAGVGALAMGSATYEFILAHEEGRWPYEGTPSWVFTSRELPVPPGADVRFASGSVRPVHEDMRVAAGERNVWVMGGGDLASQFVDEGLLDELIVTLVPVVLGEGIPTFAHRLGQRLHLTGMRSFQGGVVELRYRFVGQR
jgi:dihydrofolate reductase